MYICQHGCIFSQENFDILKLYQFIICDLCIICDMDIKQKPHTVKVQLAIIIWSCAQKFTIMFSLTNDKRIVCFQLWKQL